jgi:hypothetical protein
MLKISLSSTRNESNTHFCSICVLFTCFFLPSEKHVTP